MTSFPNHGCVCIVGALLLASLACHGHAQDQKKPAQQWQVRGIQSGLSDPLLSVKLLALQEMQCFSRIDGISPLQIAPFLTASDHDLVSAAATTLGQMQTKEQAPALMKLFNDPSRSIGVRGTAAYALGYIKANEQAPKLLQFLKDPSSDPSLRSDVAYALGEMQAKDQIPELAELLKDSHNQVRSAAAVALGQMQAKEQIPELAQLLIDPDFDVRRAAASALGKMQAKEHASEIAKLLNDPMVVVLSRCT